MSINLDLPKAATAAIDEFTKNAPQLEAQAQLAIDYLVAQLKTVLVGRTVIITIQ